MTESFPCVVMEQDTFDCTVALQNRPFGRRGPGDHTEADSKATHNPGGFDPERASCSLDLGDSDITHDFMSCAVALSK